MGALDFDKSCVYCNWAAISIFHTFFDRIKPRMGLPCIWGTQRRLPLPRGLQIQYHLATTTSLGDKNDFSSTIFAGRYFEITGLILADICSEHTIFT